MEHQGYNDRLDEHLGRRHAHRHGKYHQTLKDRRHESEAMEKHYHEKKYAADPHMDRSHRHMTGMEHHKMHYPKKMRRK